MVFWCNFIVETYRNRNVPSFIPGKRKFTSTVYNKTHNMNTNCFKEQRLSLVMAFCAEEKCKYENVFQKLPDHLINVRNKNFQN